MNDIVGWRVVVDDVDAADVELVADVLFQAGAVGIEERVGAPGRTALLAGMVDEPAAIAAAAAHPGARVEPIHDDGWADAWREFARPVRVGNVIVQPAWVDTGQVASTGDTVVEIDPGRAFGSGGHETTQLALALLLDELAGRPRGARVLDVGCGSGVLGIAAAMVAGAAVVAVDTDPDAIVVTVDNARRNHVGGLLHASATPLDQVDGTFDVVVANILAVTLRELLPELAARLEEGGALILSGMLADQVAEVHRCATASGLRAGDERSDGGWSAVRFTS